MIEKYKWKSRILLVKTPSYKNLEYLTTKKIFQKEIKQFHKRTIKMITKINKAVFSAHLIDFDGKTKFSFKRLNLQKLFKKTDRMTMSNKLIKKKLKPINLSLFSDYNPKTTTPGLGFKDRKKALYTLRAIKKRDRKYQVNVVATMLGRAMKHPSQTEGMKEAISVFNKWMINYKKNRKYK
tara:strand:+ start:334 stop:876 length:543 start_codon:yes stop_codon:yes gene_type:complete